MVKVITEHEVAKESLDHQFPYGVVRDNHTSHQLIHEIMQMFGDNPKIYDIGCAGGQFIIDSNSMGCTAVGIEGSDTVSTNPDAHGYLNWKEYKGQYLFHADATKDYTIIDTKTNEMMKFDLISAWEVIEHIEETELEMFFSQINKHMSDRGLFIGSICLLPCYHSEYKVDFHKTVRPKEWWYEFFSKSFEIIDYPFGGYVRVFGEKNIPICLRKKNGI